MSLAILCVLEFRCGWIGVGSVLQAEACCLLGLVAVFFDFKIPVLLRSMLSIYVG